MCVCIFTWTNSEIYCYPGKKRNSHILIKNLVHLNLWNLSTFISTAKWVNWKMRYVEIGCIVTFVYTHVNCCCLLLLFNLWLIQSSEILIDNISIDLATKLFLFSTDWIHRWRSETKINPRSHFFKKKKKKLIE